VLFDDIQTGFIINQPGINYKYKTSYVTLDTYLGSLTIVYAHPYFSGSYNIATTPSGNTFAISGLRDDVTLSASSYTFTVNNNECSGKFRVVLSITDKNSLYAQIWRESSVTVSASQYEHYIYRSEYPYLSINIKKTINGTSVLTQIPIYFAVKVYNPTG
jgi:hypothetical protein